MHVTIVDNACYLICLCFSRQKQLNEEARNQMRNCSFYYVGEGKLHNDVSWDVGYRDKIEEFLMKTVLMEAKVT